MPACCLHVVRAARRCRAAHRAMPPRMRPQRGDPLPTGLRGLFRHVGSMGGPVTPAAPLRKRHSPAGGRAIPRLGRLGGVTGCATPIAAERGGSATAIGCCLSRRRRARAAGPKERQGHYMGGRLGRCAGNAARWSGERGATSACHKEKPGGNRSRRVRFQRSEYPIRRRFRGTIRTRWPRLRPAPASCTRSTRSRPCRGTGPRRPRRPSGRLPSRRQSRRMLDCYR